MGNVSGSEVRLDFEDLVKELDQVEREAKALQLRISEFLGDAREAMGEEESVEAVSESAAVPAGG